MVLLWLASPRTCICRAGIMSAIPAVYGIVEEVCSWGCMAVIAHVAHVHFGHTACLAIWWMVMRAALCNVAAVVWHDRVHGVVLACGKACIEIWGFLQEHGTWHSLRCGQHHRIMWVHVPGTVHNVGSCCWCVQRFLNTIFRRSEGERIRLWEYERDGYSFHAKGQGGVVCDFL